MDVLKKIKTHFKKCGLPKPRMVQVGALVDYCGRYYIVTCGWFKIKRFFVYFRHGEIYSVHAIKGGSGC